MDTADRRRNAGSLRLLMYLHYLLFSFYSLYRLRSKVKNHSLVVASYDIVRNDGDFFRLVYSEKQLFVGALFHTVFIN